MTKTYLVLFSKLAGLQHEISILNRRAFKLGAPGIDIRETGRVEDREFRSETGLVVRVSRLIEVEVSGESPKFAGWTLAAVLEHTPEGNLIRKSPDCKSELAIYRDCKPTCAHCNLARHRRDTFIVIHETTGTTQQVGSTCIRDFLGHTSPHWLAQLAELHFSVAELCEEAEQDNEGREHRLLPIKTFLAYCIMSARKLGFITGKRAHDDITGRTSSTAQSAQSFMFPPKGCLTCPRPTDEDLFAADLARSYVLHNLADQENLSDFQHNLLTAAKCEAIEFRSAGIAAYIVEYYRRETEKAKEQAVQTYFGTPGKRVRAEKITFIRSTGFDTSWGYTMIYTFAAADGSRLVWKTGTGQDWQAGEEITATFTVKSHEVYNGNKQTKISRLTV